ncbi:MAG: ChaN family lipoprotein, partial [Bdellovibrionales bacterium]
MINQRDWLQTRKNLLEQVKSQVQIRLGPLPSALRQYAKKLDHDFRGSWRPAAEAELTRAIAKCKILLSADFHAYAQSQRAHIRLLRDCSGSRRVVLALECIETSKEAAVKKFLAGHLSEGKFLEAIEWDKNWGFPWENYRPLFELARDRGFEVRGIGNGRSSSLEKRDAWTATRLLKFQRENPEALVFAVMGEWHLASGHLPKRLRAKLKGSGAVAVVHQDVEQLYFKLAVQNRESAVDILKAPGDRFCLMVSPPWMKWQSYLMYLEHAYDRDLQEDLAIDYTDHVVSLIELLETDLKIQTKKSHVQVFCANSQTSLARLKLSLAK